MILKVLKNTYYFIEYLIVRILFAIIRCLPLVLTRWCAWGLATIAYFLFLKRRKIALHNLRFAFRIEKTEKEKQVRSGYFPSAAPAHRCNMWLHFYVHMNPTNHGRADID